MSYIFLLSIEVKLLAVAEEASQAHCDFVMLCAQSEWDYG